MNGIQCGIIYKASFGPFGLNSYYYACLICSLEFSCSTEFEKHESCHLNEVQNSKISETHNISDDITVSCTNAQAPSKNTPDQIKAEESSATYEDISPKRKRAKKIENSKKISRNNQFVLNAEKAGRIKCICCKTYYACNGRKRQHIFMKRQDGKEPRKCCDQCPANFESEDKYEHHMNVHLLPNPLVCPHCEEVFPTKDSLLVHIFVAEDSISARNIKISDADSLDAHGRKILQNRILESQRKFKCDICYCRFIKKNSLEKHMKKHSEGLLTATFTCEVCGLEFKQVSNLKAHLRKHLDDKPFHCNICGKNFASSYKTDHMRFHEGEKSFLCSLCDARFFVSNHLRTHMKRHQNVKSHKCLLCDRSFFFLSALKDHMRSEHTKERPFKCDVCGTAFARRKSLREHSRLHGEKKYKCRYCDLYFAQTSGRRGHEKIIHNAAPNTSRTTT